MAVMNDHEAAITMDVPVHYVASFKELMASHPGLGYVSQGWIIRKIVIYGQRDAIGALRQELLAWWREQERLDDW
jgi:hypothetical protein